MIYNNRYTYFKLIKRFGVDDPFQTVPHFNIDFQSYMQQVAAKSIISNISKHLQSLSNILKCKKTNCCREFHTFQNIGNHSQKCCAFLNIALHFATNHNCKNHHDHYDNDNH